MTQGWVQMGFLGTALTGGFDTGGAEPTDTATNTITAVADFVSPATFEDGYALEGPPEAVTTPPIDTVSEGWSLAGNADSPGPPSAPRGPAGAEYLAAMALVPVGARRSGGNRTEFHIIRRLGGGSQGDVYLAECISGPLEGQLCAIKTNKNSSAADEQGMQFSERFRDEARLLARMHDPRVVRVNRMGTIVVKDKAVDVIAMDYIDGPDLSKLVKNGPVPPKAALQIIYDLADVLYIHKDRVTHRDIKPANIKLTRNGEVRLIDFGVAKAEFEDREAGTVDGAIFGTPVYLPPRLLATHLDGCGQNIPGEGISHATDMFALGVTLAGLLLGKTAQDILHLAVNPTAKFWPIDKEKYNAAVEYIENLIQAQIASSYPGTPSVIVEAVCQVVKALLSYDPETRPDGKGITDYFKQDFENGRLMDRVPGDGLRFFMSDWNTQHPEAAPEAPQEISDFPRTFSLSDTGGFEPPEELELSDTAFVALDPPGVRARSPAGPQPSRIRLPAILALVGGAAVLVAGIGYVAVDQLLQRSRQGAQVLANEFAPPPPPAEPITIYETPTDTPGTAVPPADPREVLAGEPAAVVPVARTANTAREKPAPASTPKPAVTSTAATSTAVTSTTATSPAPSSSGEPYVISFARASEVESVSYNGRTVQGNQISIANLPNRPITFTVAFKDGSRSSWTVNLGAQDKHHLQVAKSEMSAQIP